VSVPVGVDLLVGTKNRRHDDEFNCTIFIVYFVVPQVESTLKSLE